MGQLRVTRALMPRLELLPCNPGGVEEKAVLQLRSK